jgi:hypothetical protein
LEISLWPSALLSRWLASSLESRDGACRSSWLSEYQREKHAVRAHVPVESLHLRDSEAQLDLSYWVLVGSRVQGSLKERFLKERLTRYREIKLSVVGRKSGRTISIPVWFVLEGEKP